MIRTEGLSYQAIVEQKFRDELEFFAYGRGRSKAHTSISHLIEHVSVSYKGRTLVELIQNAYDPHPASCADGEISILFDPSETEFGCLYVANRGVGFTKKNFEGLCDVASSSKVVNEGIGNKGLGFRSVAQISKHPEVYSSDPLAAPGPGFTGFCFGFPTDSQLRSLLVGSSHSSYLDEVVRTMPRSLLPVFLHDRPGHVDDFALQGFATVVRMPLDRNEASIDVQNQIEALCDHQLPIHLFLDRIFQIRIEVRGQGASNDAKSFCRVLPRRVRESWQLEDIRLEIVKTDDDAEYVVGNYRLPDEEFRPVLDAGLASGTVPESWSDWRDPPEVSVAVGLGGPGTRGRLYNFLPMEAIAKSPCAAHLNAPFYSDIDRKKLVENVPLNDYFLDAIAALCLRTAKILKELRPDLAPEVVLDLTMWEGDAAGVVAQVSEKLTGDPLEDLLLVPSCPGSPRSPWSSLSAVFDWPGARLGLTELTPGAIASVAQVDLLDSRINSQRLNRLISVARCAGYELEPSPELAAKWAERFAHELQARAVAIEPWNSFYADLITLFSDAPEALKGRTLLLTDHNKLAPTLKEATAQGTDSQTPRRQAHINQTVFLPNTQVKPIGVVDGEVTDDESEAANEEYLASRIPKSLERFIRILNTNLACASRSDESGVRRFLIENRLVNQFLTEDIQRLLANLTANPGPGKNPNMRRMEALRFAFDLSAQGTKTAELGEMPFHVPTQSKRWVRATRAFFGATWPSTRGKELGELVEATKQTSADLRSVGENMLIDLREWNRLSKTDGRNWVRFLSQIGVQQVLQLTNVRPPGALQEQGYLFQTRLLERCRLSDEARAFWKQELPNDLPNPYTPYTVRGLVPALPGQGDFQDFTPSSKAVYAREILAALREVGAAALSIHLFRPQHRHSPNETVWPSPLGSFLRNAEWLPVQSALQNWRFARPAEAWHLPLHATNVRPDFLITVAGDCRSYLDAHPEVQEVLQECCNLNIVNSIASCAAQLRLLGQIATNSQVPSGLVSAFDTLYAEGWRRVSEDPNVLEGFLNSAPFFIAAHAGSAVVGHRLDSADGDEIPEGSYGTPLAYLADDQTPTTRELLKELGRDVFDFKFPGRASVCAKIREIYPRVECVSNVRLEIILGDSTFKTRGEDRFLCPIDRRWLQDTILVVCDLASGGFLNLGVEAFDRLRALMSRLRYRLVDDIHLRIDGRVVQLPEFTQGCLFVNDQHRPTLLIRTPDSELSWAVLQQASHTLAEALGYPVQLSSVLSSAFGQLSQRHGPGALIQPSNSDLQAVCRKGAQAVHDSLRGLRHMVDSLVQLLRPAILAVGGKDAVGRFEKSVSSLETESDLRNTLNTIGASWHVAPDVLFSACMQSDHLDGLRRYLRLDLATFNSAIRDLGPPYSELDFAEDHVQQFKAYVAIRRGEIQNELRSAFLSTFTARGDLSDYVAASRLEGLGPEPGWATMYDELPEPMMLERVNHWLGRFEAGPLQSGGSSSSPTVSDCRTANRDALRKLASELWATVSVWCRKNGRQMPERWRIRDEAPRALVTQALASGLLDFEVLEQASLIGVLAALSDWPEGMPETLDPNALGVDRESVDEALEKARHENAERNRLERIVVVGDQELSEDKVDLPDSLALLMESYATSGSSLKLPARVISLEALEAPPKHGAAGSRQKSKKPLPSRRLSESKRRIIGLLGERFAFEWLRLQYPALVNEDCWVSTNRERALQLPGGDDGLGYDFVIDLPSYSLYFEVKSTSSDDFFFSLGPTEVEAALRFRSDSRHRYRVLFVLNVLTPKSTRPLLLPNPYSEQFRDRFQLVTKGEQGFRFLPTG